CLSRLFFWYFVFDFINDLRYAGGHFQLARQLDICPYPFVVFFTEINVSQMDENNGLVVRPAERQPRSDLEMPLSSNVVFRLKGNIATHKLVVIAPPFT